MVYFRCVWSLKFSTNVKKIFFYYCVLCNITAVCLPRQSKIYCNFLLVSCRSAAPFITIEPQLVENWIYWAFNRKLWGADLTCGNVSLGWRHPCCLQDNTQTWSKDEKLSENSCKSIEVKCPVWKANSCCIYMNNSVVSKIHSKCCNLTSKAQFSHQYFSIGNVGICVES